MERKNNQISSYLQGVKTLGIAGHVSPDGDCVGSTVGLYLYIKENYPKIQADLYLETIRPEFGFLQCVEESRSVCEEDKVYDLFITVDVSTKDRIGVAEEAFNKAKRTLGIDHHVSNIGFADENYIIPHASSSCEVVFEMLEEEKISKAAAEGLYLGIVHDTGVFQYSSTGAHTMRIAGSLMEKGIDHTKIIEKTFFEKTYAQQKVLGKVLADSKCYLNGKFIAGVLTKEEMDTYGVTKQDLDGVVSQLRLTKDVETAAFLYQTDEETYKISLRSKSYVDVNRIAGIFGGGGHIRAAGCTVQGRPEDIIKQLLSHIERAL